MCSKICINSQINSQFAQHTENPSNWSGLQLNVCCEFSDFDSHYQTVFDQTRHNKVTEGVRTQRVSNPPSRVKSPQLIRLKKRGFRGQEVRPHWAPQLSISIPQPSQSWLSWQHSRWCGPSANKGLTAASPTTSSWPHRPIDTRDGRTRLDAIAL